MTTPIWFLDIDGVVNAIRPASAGVDSGYLRYDIAVDEHGTTTVYPIHVHPEVIGFVNRVHREGLAEVRWLTTWGRQAAERFAPAVGLDAFEVAAEPPPDGSGRSVWRPDWWKLVAVQAQAAGRFVFTDDDLGRESRAVLRQLPDPSLLLSPSPGRGLEDAHLERVETFLRNRVIGEAAVRVNAEGAAP